jgi:aspartyl-tRNA(Asn)/glutamyl-tRNA(Gln) amidotransferase subunit C
MSRPGFSLSLSDIQRIAHLARLELTTDEAENARAQLNHFFELLTQMQAVDTHGVEPLAHPIEHNTLRLRDDVLTESPDREAYQKCAPDAHDGLYRVPKVIE